jgi:hypothetical protein
MIEREDMSDREWAEYWLAAQRRTLAVVEACKAAGSMLPRARELIARAKAAYQPLREMMEAARGRRLFGQEAARTGAAIGDPRLTQLGLRTAKASADYELVLDSLMETAVRLMAPDLKKAAEILDSLPAEPVYSRRNPRPGVPAWYYPEEDR